MSSETGSAGVVLIVEDEKDLADLYAQWLAETYETKVAYSGEEALEVMDDSVDIALLDRRLPNISGDQVLGEMRDAGYDCPVVMVSAVEPDFDVIELGFDDYVVKPVNKNDLQTVVVELLSVEDAPNTVREHLALVAKRNALRNQMEESELRESDEYERLTAAIDSFEERIVSLAEEYLESRQRALRPKSRDVFESRQEELQRELDSMDENDLLYPVLQEEIQKLEEWTHQPEDNVNVKRRFLETISEGFVAKGFWLDSRIIRALNQIFFDKKSETLVVEKQWVTEGDNLSGRQLLVVSQAVRDLASEELAEMSA